MTRYGSGTSKRACVAAAIALAQLVVLSPLPGYAQKAAVRIAGQSVFAIPAGSGQLTADNRAQIVQQNLDNALVASTDRLPTAVKIVYVKGTPVITLGGYQVVSVDAASARADSTTPAALAQQWADSIRKVLADTGAVNDYIAGLTGGNAGPGGSTAESAAAGQPADKGQTSTAPLEQGRVVYVPAGMVIPITLTTGISSENAQPGDRIEGKVSQAVNLENGSIPAGSLVVGQVVSSEAGARMGHSGALSLKFITLRTPDGAETPITAHIVSNAGKAAQTGSDTLIGETTRQKVESAAIRGAIGAGSGALLGTVIGAIAGGGHGAGSGAWSGLAIGGALGVADALLLRKGTDVKLESGQQMQLLLDAPAQLAGTDTGM